MKDEGHEEFEMPPILPALRKGLIHCTSLSALASIFRIGKILPNDGSFPFTYPQSQNSYASHNRAVSLFDFETPSVAELLDEKWKWGSFFFVHKPTIALRLDRDCLKTDLIPNNAAKQEVGFKKMWIPRVEVWYPEPIPVEVICGYVLAVSQRDFSGVEITQFGEVRHKIIKEIEETVVKLRKRHSTG